MRAAIMRGEMSQPPAYPPAESSRREVPRLGQHLLTVLQVLVTVGLLYWLFYEPHRRATIWNALQTADWRWMIAALAAAGACEFLGILRWQLFLKMLHLRVRLWEVTRLFFFRARPAGMWRGSFTS